MSYKLFMTTINSSISRPILVTILLWLGLILTITHVWEAWALFQQQSLAQSWGINLNWRLAGAIIWSFIWLWLTVQLWREQLAAIRWFPDTLLIHTLYHLSWRLLLPTRPSDWILQTGLGVLLTMISYAIVYKYQTNPDKEVEI